MPDPAGALPLPLMIWLSPSFPVGAFAYSHGLEWAAEAGDLPDAGSLSDWILDLARYGSLRSDAILLSLAHCAAQAGDDAGLRDLAEFALAFAPSAERHLETVQQGNSFLRIVNDVWPCPAIERFRAAWSGDCAYPISLGVTAAGHGIGRAILLSAFCLAFAANLTSAAIRLGVLGQTAAQRILAQLLPDLEAAASAALDARLDDLGSCTFRSDLASLRHETQYTRIFRS
jgi:urease accessory protein